MSTNLYICSTIEIAWEDFREFLLGAGQPLGLVETNFNAEFKNIWLIQKDLHVEFDISLINSNDITAFSIQDMSDELHLPFQSGISMGIHYKFNKVYAAAMLTVEPKTLRLLTKQSKEKAERLTMELLCRLAEQWPLVVDTSGITRDSTYLTGHDLFQRLKEGKGLRQQDTTL